MIATVAMVPLNEILIPVSRPESVEPDKIYSILGAHWYAGGLYIKDKKPGSEVQADKVYRVEQGDFVYNRLFAWKGSFAVATGKDHNCYVSNEFPTFVINQYRADPQYLLKHFSRSSVWKEALNLSSGGTPTSRNRLKEEKLLSMKIPLPSLQEQRRIVARIEEFVAKVEEVRWLHQEAVEETEAIKASTANALFDVIKVNDWPIAALGEIADIHAGVTLGRTLNGATIRLPYLRVANVQDGYLDLSNIKETEILPTEFEKWHLKPGDILLTEGGDWDKLGRGAVWHNEIPNCIHQNHIFCVRTNPDDFDPDFLLALINSPSGKTYFQGASKQTTNLASINQKQLRAFRVFQPPLAEQQRIVTYLDALQYKIETLKRVQSEISAELGALLPSILDKAFKGEL